MMHELGLLSEMSNDAGTDSSIRSIFAERCSLFHTSVTEDHEQNESKRIWNTYIGIKHGFLMTMK